MKFLFCLSVAAIFMSSSAFGQKVEASSSSNAVTAEYYYRVKWGSIGDFKRLYDRNHAPIMREMQKRGFVTKIEVEEPFTHLAGGPRWDLRVTVTYRDVASAMFSGPFAKAFGETAARLFPDKAKFEAEDAKRFALLEDHWDIFVMPVSE